MIGGGVIFLFVDRWFKHPRFDSERNVSNTSAFKIGCFQVLSILLPGFSRSGATIIGGLSQGYPGRPPPNSLFSLPFRRCWRHRSKVYWDVHKEHPDVLTKDNATLLDLSGIVTFLVSIVVIRFFIGFLQKHGFKIWGYYRIVVGLVMLVLLWRGLHMIVTAPRKSDQWLGHV